MPVSRRADLDWLRVLAFGLLIAYHAGMAWSGWAWHLTSPDRLDGLRAAMQFVNRWRMPLVFLVSGAAIMLALGHRPAPAFIGDRLRRLGIPLVFGMLVIVPPQVYLERRWRGQFAGSFLDWLPQAFSGGAYPAGNVSWHHLWFLVYVLVQTVVLLPVFLWLRSASGRRMLLATGRIAARLGLQWLMALPLAAATLWLAPLSRNPNGLVGDWFGLVYYGTLLLYGALLFASPDLLAALNRQRWGSAGLGVAAYAALYVLFFEGAVRPTIAALCAPVGGQHPGLAVRHRGLRQSASDPAASLPRRGYRGGLSVLHPAPDGDGDCRLLAAALGRPAGRRLRPGGDGDLSRDIGDLCRAGAPISVRAAAVRIEGWGTAPDRLADHFVTGWYDSGPRRVLAAAGSAPVKSRAGRPARRIA